MKPLTKSQKQLYEFVCDTIKRTGCSPTFREIQLNFKYASIASVFNLVKVLKKKGYFMESKRSPITLSHQKMILDEKEEISLPFIGTIAQGFPIETFPQSRTIKVPSSLVHSPENTYILKAKGETLHEERIADGDLLIVEARQNAHSGEMVLLTLNSFDTLIKKYFSDGPFARLEGCVQHQPIVINKDELIIQGILIGLIRRY